MTDGPRATPRHIWALLGVMVFLWSINFVFAKYALREFPPVLLGSLRFTVAAAVLVPFYFWQRYRKQRDAAAQGELRNHRNLWWKLLLIGVIGVGGNQLTFLVGLGQTSVAHASIIIGLTPVFVLLFSVLLGHERITTNKTIGLAIAFCGLAVLQSQTSTKVHASLLGDFFVFIAAVTFAIFTVGGKTVRPYFDGITINTVAYVSAGVILSPVTLWHASRFSFSGVTLTGWLSMLYMALFSSVVAYIIFSHAMQFLPASKITMLSYLQPVLATLFAVPLLGEPVTKSLAAGGALVLAGVWCAERRQ